MTRLPLQAVRQFCIIKGDGAATSISLMFKRPLQIKGRPIPGQDGSEWRNSRLIGIVPDRPVHELRDLRVEGLVNRLEAQPDDLFGSAQSLI